MKKSSPKVKRGGKAYVVPANQKVKGIYNVKIGESDINIEIIGFEKNNSETIALYPSDPFHSETMSGLVVKNTAISNISKGKIVEAISSKTGKKVKIKRVADLGAKGYFSTGVDDLKLTMENAVGAIIKRKNSETKDTDMPLEVIKKYNDDEVGVGMIGSGKSLITLHKNQFHKWEKVKLPEVIPAPKLTYVESSKYPGQFTIGEDDGEKPMYTKEELELFEEGYKMELEFNASRRGKAEMEAYQKEFKVPTKLTHTEDEFGGRWRIWIEKVPVVVVSLNQGGPVIDEEMVGKRIAMIQMANDPNPIEPGTMGTIKMIDAIGQIHVDWDNGRTLAVIPDEDEYEIESEEKMATGGQVSKDNLSGAIKYIKDAGNGYSVHSRVFGGWNLKQNGTPVGKYSDSEIIEFAENIGYKNQGNISTDVLFGGMLGSIYGEKQNKNYPQVVHYSSGGRLALLKKMDAKNPSPELKIRIKLLEKMGNKTPETIDETKMTYSNYVGGEYEGEEVVDISGWEDIYPLKAKHMKKLDIRPEDKEKYFYAHYDSYSSDLKYVSAFSQPLDRKHLAEDEPKRS